MSAGRLEGKVAVVTGGNSGIGLATAVEFARQGAAVAITGRDEATLRAAEAAVAAAGGEVLAVRADVTRPAELDAAVAAVRERFGRIDVLFVNAGFGAFAPVDQVTEDAYDALFDTNAKGAFFTVQKALPLMGEGGSIVFNGSINGQIGMAGSSVYSATKAAVRSLARTLSADLVDRGIRVNVVSPGPISTPIWQRTGMPPEAVQGVAAEITSKVPMKRFGAPDEIAKAVLFLASPDSSFFLGAELVADGGISQL
jgi:NAD(P)-dependent dehydrogenase (short-subunit alcohol dehydrogenase family)